MKKTTFALIVLVIILQIVTITFFTNPIVNTAGGILLTFFLILGIIQVDELYHNKLDTIKSEIKTQVILEIEVKLKEQRQAYIDATRQFADDITMNNNKFVDRIISLAKPIGTTEAFTEVKEDDTVIARFRNKLEELRFKNINGIISSCKIIGNTITFIDDKIEYKYNIELDIIKRA